MLPETVLQQARYKIKKAKIGGVWYVTYDDYRKSLNDVSCEILNDFGDRHKLSSAFGEASVYGIPPRKNYDKIPMEGRKDV